MLPAPGPVALRAVSDAEKNVGVTEDGPPYLNSGTSVNLYLNAVGLGPGYAWCAAFVEYREMAAAHALGVSLPPDFPRGTFAAAAGDWAQWAKEHRHWFSDINENPKRGDLVCFDIASEGGIHHIGIVACDGDDTGFCSIEGNTRADDSDPVRDGYCVARRTRTYGNIGPGGGFIRLPW